MNDGYWIICTTPYSIDGIDVSKGSMKYSYARLPTNGYWRRATQTEIEGRQCFKGRYYNHNVE